MLSTHCKDICSCFSVNWIVYPWPIPWVHKIEVDKYTIFLYSTCIKYKYPTDRYAKSEKIVFKVIIIQWKYIGN